MIIALQNIAILGITLLDPKYLINKFIFKLFAIKWIR